MGFFFYFKKEKKKMWMIFLFKKKTCTYVLFIRIFFIRFKIHTKCLIKVNAILILCSLKNQKKPTK